MSVLSRVAAEVKLYLYAMLRGGAQLAFCDSPLAGVLVLGGIGLVSPFSGLGALIGAGFGTVAGRFLPAYGRDAWATGLASFNPAIVGLLWGGFLASGEIHPAFLIPAVALSMMLDIGLRRLLGLAMLPSLSSGAFATVYLVSLMAAPPGAWFWTDAPTNALVPFGLIGAACIAAAMVMKSRSAGVWALLLSTIAFLACWLANQDPLSLTGLWAITVPLATFGIHAIFLRGSVAGCIAGTIAACLGAFVWLAWQGTPLGGWLPPLLWPFIVGVWLSMILIRRLEASPLAHASFWRVVRMLAAARAANRTVVALLRDLRGAATPASSFISGAWLDPQMPRSTFSPDHLRTSSRSRQAFWDACDRLRVEARAGPSGGGLVARVARLQQDGWLGGVVIQDLVAPTQIEELEETVPLHGDIDRTQCLDCGAMCAWPPMAVWRRCDLRCPACQGPVVPALTLFGSAIDVAIRDRLSELESRCDVILVLGEEASEPATVALLERARSKGASVVFVAHGAARYAYPRALTDLSVFASPQRFLAQLYLVLRGWEMVLETRACRALGRSARSIRKESRRAAG